MKLEISEKYLVFLMWPKDDTTFKFGNYTFLPLRPMRQGALQQQKQVYLIPDYLLYMKYAACHIIDFFFPFSIREQLK